MRRAVTASDMVEADIPAVELRNFVSVSLDGARTVMLEAPPNTGDENID